MTKIVETEYFIVPKKDDAHTAWPTSEKVEKYWYDIFDYCAKGTIVKYHNIDKDGKVTLLVKNIYLNPEDYPLKPEDDNHTFYQNDSYCYTSSMNVIQDISNLFNGGYTNEEYTYQICEQTRVVEYDLLCVNEENNSCKWLITNPLDNDVSVSTNETSLGDNVDSTPIAN